MNDNFEQIFKFLKIAVLTVEAVSKFHLITYKQ